MADSRNKSDIQQFDDFPELNDGKSSKGTTLRPDTMVKIEYKASPGYKFQFGCDKARGRSGHLAVPIDEETKTMTNKP